MRVLAFSIRVCTTVGLTIVFLIGLSGVSIGQIPASSLTPVLAVGLLAELIRFTRRPTTAILFVLVALGALALVLTAEGFDPHLLIVVVLAATFGALSSRSLWWILGSLALAVWLWTEGFLGMGLVPVMVHLSIQFLDHLVDLEPELRRPVARVWKKGKGLVVFFLAYAVAVSLFAIIYRFLDVIADGGALGFDASSPGVEPFGDFLFFSAITIASGPPTDMALLDWTARFLVGLEVFVGISIIVVYLQEVIRASQAPGTRE